jgi:hypothetical protein
MNLVVVVLLSVVIVGLAVLMHHVQASLERWDHRRHVDD